MVPKGDTLMLIRKGFKYRIYPNQEQRQRLRVQFGHARYVYPV